MGSGIANRIFKQRPNGLSLIAEMFGNFNAGVAIVEVQGAVSFRHIESGNLIRLGLPFVHKLLWRVKDGVKAALNVDGQIQKFLKGQQFKIFRNSTSIIRSLLGQSALRRTH